MNTRHPEPIRIACPVCQQSIEFDAHPRPAAGPGLAIFAITFGIAFFIGATFQAFWPFVATHPKAPASAPVPAATVAPAAPAQAQSPQSPDQRLFQSVFYGDYPGGERIITIEFKNGKDYSFTNEIFSLEGALTALSREGWAVDKILSENKAVVSMALSAGARRKMFYIEPKDSP